MKAERNNANREEANAERTQRVEGPQSYTGGDGLRIVGEANRNLPAGCLGIDHAIYRFTDGRSYAAGKD